MKKRIIMTAVMTSMVIYMLSSCYKNKEDILALPAVSFRSDVVPIIVAGGCGCHNNGTTRAVQFSHVDTVFFDAILARDSILNAMATTGTHPGGGEIYFKPNEKEIIAKWYKEGSNDDGGGCTVTGPITYNKNISPIYLTSCKGSTCHGGIAAPLDYNKMVAEKNTLTTMMNSGGATGHPGGSMSLSSCTVNIFQEWIAQGQPQ
jgi:hypothetical protein